MDRPLKKLKESKTNHLKQASFITLSQSNLEPQSQDKSTLYLLRLFKTLKKQTNQSLKSYFQFNLKKKP